MMKNIFKKTEFLFGITSYSKLPEDIGNEVLLAGRSNAGKSSALNALSENPKLARISKTPGRTTEINFFRVNDELMLLDLPGYGFAKSSKSKKKDWGPLLGEYFQKRKALAAVIIFMDIRHPLKEIDIEMVDLCRNFKVPFLPVLTKSDKFSKNNIAKAKLHIKKQIPESDPVAVSSKDIIGFDKLSREILNFIK
jgi:GTP-binding protein